MAQTVVMPQLGNSVESCLITAWHVKVGDTVAANTVLCDIETDKSSMDVPAGVAGVVLALRGAEGDDVPVKSPIAIVGEPGEQVPSDAGDSGADAATGGAGEGDAHAELEAASGGEATSVPEPTADSESGDDHAEPADGPAPQVNADAPSGDRPASPRARNLAASTGVPLSAVAEASGPHGRIIARDVEAAAQAGPGLTAGARAAAEAGSYQPGMAGTGIGGRVTRADLARGAAAPVETPAVAPAAPAAAPAVEAGSVTETPLKGIRKLIAERMKESLAISAQLSYDASAPATALLALRARLKATDPSLGLNVVTIGDLVGLITARVVANYPAINAHLVDGVLRSYADVHLGMAVDTPRGLLVPTIRNAGTMGLRQFAATTKDLAAQAQSGKISPDLLAGATFTVTNLGSFGIESFTPIVNQPQTGILGINAIVPRAVANKDGSVGVEQRISFSLTADHQVVDGADAARFLRDLTTAIASADLFLLG